MSIRKFVLFLLLIIECCYATMHQANHSFTNDLFKLAQQNNDEHLIRKRSVHSKFRVSKQRYFMSSVIKSNSSPHCSKQNFVVDFGELGWRRWIIWPTSFNAFYCSGKCNLEFRSGTLRRDQARKSFQPINHAQIMQILEFKNPKLNRHLTKCSSVKLKPLTILFLDEYNRMRIKSYPDMIVEECGCR